MYALCDAFFFFFCYILLYFSPFFLRCRCGLPRNYVIIVQNPNEKSRSLNEKRKQTKKNQPMLLPKSGQLGNGQINRFSGARESICNEQKQYEPIQVICQNDKLIFSELHAHESAQTNGNWIAILFASERKGKRGRQKKCVSRTFSAIVWFTSIRDCLIPKANWNRKKLFTPIDIWWLAMHKFAAIERQEPRGRERPSDDFVNYRFKPFTQAIGFVFAIFFLFAAGYCCWCCYSIR